VEEAPHGEIATMTFPHGFDPAKEAELMREAAQKFPSVTSIRVKDVLDSINTLLGQIAIAIRAASSIGLLASVLVLGGALASGQQARIHDAVVLKTLGATRGKLIAAFTLEYGLIGLATALFGLGAGGLAAYVISTHIMHIEFVWLWPQALIILTLALAITISIGLFGSWDILGRKPAAYLRDL
jgi:putative ABC transport system permease protein